MKEKRNKTPVEYNLSENDLNAIQHFAIKNADNPEKFKSYFSNGFFNGTERLKSKINKLADIEKLKEYTCEINYEEFIRIFEKGHVNVNHRFTYDIKDNCTFLHLLVENDTMAANHPQTKDRKKLANYLLKKGADMYIKPDYNVLVYEVPIIHAIAEQAPSCWELAVNYANNKTGLNYYLNALFNSPSPKGVNIFPILEEWHLQSQVKSESLKL